MVSVTETIRRGYSLPEQSPARKCAKASAFEDSRPRGTFALDVNSGTVGRTSIGALEEKQKVATRRGTNEGKTIGAGGRTNFLVQTEKRRNFCLVRTKIMRA